ncbi:PAS domain-containing sensor histidine kinase [Hymenobacter glacieicola]|uniref:histidine kinase n=1 Tax=Hymenobacter glacieicola TaxID=1562124 RepID=A0ABQ1WTQ4_9BACT|nr:PAS domain-containing protein [Hymenobacter glacieicola]GGG42688.1 hypothetical protein GCM10011378_18810 [Hymenobacter glacieicola]
MSATPPFPATESPSATELLDDVLFVSLTGVLFYQPVYAPGTPEIVDFRCVRLNQAAQRMLELTEKVGWTLLSQYPSCQQNGVFTYYCQAFENGQAERFDVNYQADRLDNFFHLVARRSGSLLVVSFTDTADQNRSTVEQVLRESHARERQARADTETQRQRLHDMLMQLPVCVAITHGPDLVFELVNPHYQQLFPERVMQGLPLAVALPELRSQGIYEVLAHVYRTGEPYYHQEQETWVDLTKSGRLEKRYFNVFFQALRDADGSIYGLLNFANDVTEQVTARRQVELLNQELAIYNEELQAANEEFSINNTELAEAQRSLLNLNQELEARVEVRTTQVAEALRKAEQQGQLLEQQKQLLQHILSQVPASIATLAGPEHQYTFFNSSYYVLTGQRAQRGLSVAEALPEVNAQGFVRLLDKVYSTGQPFVGVEAPVLLYDPVSNAPRQQYIDFVYQPLVTEQGNTQGILAFIVDATDKVLARREGERSQELLQLALTAGQMGTWHLDLRTDASERSLQHDQLFGYATAQAEWGLERFMNHIVPEHRPLVVAAFEEARRTGALQFETQIVRLDGQRRWIEVRGKVFYAEDGEALRMAGVVTEITARKVVQQQLQLLTDELEATNAKLEGRNQDLLLTNQQLKRTNVDLDNFIYTASHDLKAPILNIEGLLNALQDSLPSTPDTPEVTQILELMYGSVERFKTTIAQLTDVARLQQEYAQPSTEVALAPVLEGVLLDLAPLLQETGAQLELHVEDCPMVAFSEKNLRSVVYNLISNAVKYHHPERVPRVQVQCRTEPQFLVLEVRDNGLGLDMANGQKLFVMFRRYHAHVEGTGIGLYMVNKMVENAGGRIEVASTVGEGSTFSVYLPR